MKEVKVGQDIPKVQSARAPNEPLRVKRKRRSEKCCTYSSPVIFRKISYTATKSKGRGIIIGLDRINSNG